MSRHPLGRRLTAAAVVTGALVAGSAPAHADTAADGLWYFDVLNVQDAHDAGWTGEGVTIAVFDSPINPDVPTLQRADLRIDETPRCFVDGKPDPVISTEGRAGHGTNVTSFLVGTGAGGAPKGVAPDATVLYYAVAGPENSDGYTLCLDESGEPSDDSMADAIRDAVDAGADILSISMIFSAELVLGEAIAYALANDVIIVAGLSNQGDGPISLDNSPFSTRMNGAVGVQRLDRTGNVPTHPDVFGDPVPFYDPNVDVAAPGVDVQLIGTPEGDWSQHGLGSGTSFATPIVAGFLAVVAQRYPEATPNQILQSMIHNTGGGDGVASYDEEGRVGYGFVSLTNMLRVDPTQYPDANPFLTADGLPSPEQIEAAGSAPTASPEPAPPSSPPADGLIPLVVVPAVIAVVLAGVAVVVVVLVRRRARV